MSLASGAQLGPYQILSPLGVGGMGEVYRARDSRLDREVAIKVLPEAMARDADRVARFQREAKVLASLSHTNIAGVYGFEEFDGKRFLVMELAEGETLAERLQRGPLPVRDALEISSLIAQAVEAAHEKGIIHRDLKPANVKLTADGVVKVLDFGLAKALSSDASATDIANSPTLTVEHTRPGVILGTAAYMSPEQARGRPVDKRTDIWSFGVVLFECLTGSRPFLGETTSDLVARILERDPDWTALPSDTPALIQLLLRRCLAKDRNRRLRDIGDARVDLESALSDPTTSGLLLAGAALAEQRPSSSRRYAALAAIVLLTTMALAIGWLLGRSAITAQSFPIYRFTVDLPAGAMLHESSGVGYELGSIALSPDASMLAFTVDVEGASHIFLREFAAQEPRFVPGTEGGSDPIFSPDGRWLSFNAGGKLKKVPVAGGPALTICDELGDARVWLPDGSIVVATNQGKTITRIDEKGAAAILATAGINTRTSGGEQPLLGFQTVTAVPDADYVIAGIWDGDTMEDYATVTVSLKDGAVRPILQNAIDARFVEPGHLVFLRGASVLAVAFDAKRATVMGDPVLVLDGVVSSKWADEGQFAVSMNGTLAYIPGGRRGPGRRLVRVDATGKVEPIMDGTDAIVGGLRLSPDGGNLLVLTLRRSTELWNFDLARRSFALINNVGESWGPIWTPDGRDVVFCHILPERSRGLVRKRADGSGPPERFPVEETPDSNPDSFSPDGKLLLYTLEDTSAERQSDIAMHRTDQPGSSELIVSTSANEAEAQFARDGKHFAYVSDETGRMEVFVRSLEGGKWQISQSSGSAPRWSKDGKKLFFIDRQDAMNAVDVDLEAGPRFSTPVKLFDVTKVATTDVWGTYDVLPDGSFVMAEPAEWERRPVKIHVVVNWQAELARR